MSEGDRHRGRVWLDILKTTAVRGGENDLGLFAQAMAYAIVVALAPLTIALTWLSSRVIAISATLPPTPLAGSRAAAASALGPEFLRQGPLASAVGLVFVVFGLSSLFGLVAGAVKRIWRQRARTTGVRGFLRDHVIALVLLTLAGAALFASSVVGNVASGLTGTLVALGNRLGVNLSWLSVFTSGRLLVDFAFSALLFEVISVVVPSIRPRAVDILPGALVTAAAYALGQGVLGIYLASSSRFSALGAFGGFLGLLAWAYYTSMIILWGAQLTHEIARERACTRGGESASPYVCAESNNRG